MNEANILRQIDHENIIKVYDVFDENGTLYLVLEMAMGGELFERIVAQKRLPENIAKYVTKQLLSAITYLHDNKIAHRDLKPENILMVHRDLWDIKITDFGLSRLLEYDSQMLTTMCGTPLFLAPEVLCSKKRGGYGFECDFWSMGVILYLMLVGHPPYNDKEGNLLQLVKEGKFSFPAQTWRDISHEAKDLVQKLMEIDVTKRFNAPMVANHPWMKNVAFVDNVNRDRNENVIGKKRKVMCDEMKETEVNDGDCSRYEGPVRKKHKNDKGVAGDANLMSMDTDHTPLNLTPFDSIVDKYEPKLNSNYNKNHKHNISPINENKEKGKKLEFEKKSDMNDDDTNGHKKKENDNNGNGASFVLPNSASVKDMSLDGSYNQN